MNVHHSSASAEHFTPPEICDAARATLNGITLDPASCEIANRLVRADAFLTERENSFIYSWSGSIFLNPPGGKCDSFGRRVEKIKGQDGYYYADGTPCDGPAQSAAKAWWFKLVQEWEARHVDAAIFVGFSVEILQTTQIGGGTSMVPLDFPLCFPARRVAYYVEDGDGMRVGKSPTHASVIVLVPSLDEERCGVQIAKFQKEFGVFGRVINT